MLSPLDIGKQLAHQPGTLVSVLHLLLVHLFENFGYERIQGDGEEHDSHANERGPSKEVVQ
jgi:hypothetical protein